MDQQTGRGNQKLRTRNAIIAAAQELVRQGRLPSVAEVAEAALVSPATAYRYFPDQLSLLRAAVPDELPRDSEIATPNYAATDDPAERIARAATDFLRLTLKREPIVRAVMALSLLQSIEAPTRGKEAITLRPGYRRAWIEQALAPLEGTVDADMLGRLTNALAIVISSEALISLQDVVGLDADASVDVCAWAARTLVQAVVSKQTEE